MEITLSRKSLAKAIVISWASFAILWQLLMFFLRGPEETHLIRFMIMLVKPLFLAAMIFAGYTWPRIAVGILGPISAFIILMLNIMGPDDDGLVMIIGIVGSVIYAALSITVMLSKSVDRLSR